jgi:hypothetical protein
VTSVLNIKTSWRTHSKQDQVTKKTNGRVCVVHCLSLPEEPGEIIGTKLELCSQNWVTAVLFIPMMV